MLLSCSLLSSFPSDHDPLLPSHPRTRVLPPSLASSLPTLEVGEFVLGPEDGHIGEGGRQNIVVRLEKGMEGRGGEGKGRRGGGSEKEDIHKVNTQATTERGGWEKDERDGGREGERWGRRTTPRGTESGSSRSWHTKSIETHPLGACPHADGWQPAGLPLLLSFSLSLPPLPTLKNEVGLCRSVSTNSMRKMCLGASKGKSEATTALPISVPLPISTVMRHLRGISTTTWSPSSSSLACTPRTSASYSWE